MDTFDCFDRCVTDMTVNLEIIEELEITLDRIYSTISRGCLWLDKNLDPHYRKPAPKPLPG